MTEERPTIRDLCRQWKIVEAKRNLALLEREDEVDAIMEAALQQFRAIEEKILETPMDTIGYTAGITDVDLVAMLDLARSVIGNHDCAEEQEERCQEILALVRLTLCHRDQAARLRQPAA